MLVSKILTWIKKNKPLVALIGLGVYFLPIVLIHIAYRTPASNPWFVSNWDAGDLLSYSAGFLTFIGSVILGIAVVYQNKELIKANAYIIANQIDRDEFERRSSLMLFNHKSYEKLSTELNTDCNTVLCCDATTIEAHTQVFRILELSFINASRSVSIVEIGNFCCIDNNNNPLIYNCCMASEDNRNKNYVPVMPSCELKLLYIVDTAKHDAFVFGKCTLSFNLTNSVGESCHEEISFNIKKREDGHMDISNINYDYKSQNVTRLPIHS